MRLLMRDEAGTLVFRTFDSHDLPAYAILSHTWHVDDSQEVSFRDVQESGQGAAKPGFAKIRFCAQQAAKDGLSYFWIDTCCINKSSDAELSESINSMFRWYQQATRCYVYLSDVPSRSSEDNWEDTFRQSRWFKRGWTLQELIAPREVVFYACNGDKLGDRASLETLICEVTGVAKDAIYGRHLNSFSFDEKMSWMAKRSTKKVEDGVYSMLGLFDVSMPVVYGEGHDKALRPLRREIDETAITAVTDEYAIDLSLSRIPRAAKFVARRSELSDMHELLDGRDDGRCIVVLHGLGGIGKTQLAVSYLQHKRRYSAIFWIDASSDDSIVLGFNNVARQILRQHPSTAMLASVDLEGSAARVAEAAISWLSLAGNTRWLLIFDNYDKPKVAGSTSADVVDLSQYIPDCDHGCILVTTRSSRVDLGSRIHVQRLAKFEEGLAILSNTSGRVGLEEDPEAIALVKELDGLPLALSTAGAYLEHVTTSFADYHGMYKASWLEVQKSSPRLTSYENRSMYTTWQLSLDQIKQEDEYAAKLLQLWAYFDRQDVWYELLCGGQSCEWLGRITQDRLIFDRAMRLLCSYGLVDPGSDGHKVVGGSTIGYSVHSCVHAWMVHVVNKEWDEELARVALSCVASIIPDTDVDEWWLVQKRLLPHVGRCREFVVNGKVDTRRLEWALHGMGNLYANQGKDKEAEVMYMRALQGYEEALGPKHTSTLDAVHCLAVLRKDQGRLKEAEAMYMRALQGKEEALGPKHTSTLNTVNNLGNLYAHQGKLGEAEAMYERALEGYEEALGPKHTSTLDTVNNLGILYKAQGKLGEAEAMYMRALQGYEEALGAEQIRTYVPALNTMWGMGGLFVELNQKEKASEMYAKALSGFAIIQGQDSATCKHIRSRVEALEQSPSRNDPSDDSHADDPSRSSRSRVKSYVKNFVFKGRHSST